MIQRAHWASDLKTRVVSTGNEGKKVNCLHYIMSEQRLGSIPSPLKRMKRYRDVSAMKSDAGKVKLRGNGGVILGKNGKCMHSLG